MGSDPSIGAALTTSEPRMHRAMGAQTWRTLRLPIGEETTWTAVAECATTVSRGVQPWKTGLRAAHGVTMGFP